MSNEITMVSSVGACGISRWTQPPDAENRMSGGVGGLMGAIPLAGVAGGVNPRFLTVIHTARLLAIFMLILRLFPLADWLPCMSIFFIGEECGT